MNAIKNFVRKVFFLFFYLIMRIYIPVSYKRAQRIGELKHLNAEELRIWIKAMCGIVCEFSKAGYNYRIRQIVFAFAGSKFEIIRKTQSVSKDYPIVVLCVKNDLKRIQMLVEHYRKLGIQRFAFLDNYSDDGTFEWLLEQEDIDLYRTSERYQTAVKEGWINRLVSYYGFDRWFIVTDSDELMVYNDMEAHDLKCLIAYADKRGIDRFKGLTLDMYTKDGLFGKTDNILENVCWFDTDTYHIKKHYAAKSEMVHHFGGPRYRIMGSQINLTKYPLIRLVPGTVSVSAHFQFPFENLTSEVCDVGILHFKFLEKDLEVYKQRAEPSGGFSSGGAHYKQYLNAVESGDIDTFYYEGSAKFTGSEAIRDVKLIRNIEF